MSKLNPKRLSQASTASGMEYNLDFGFTGEDLKNKELDEIRARMSQMEKSLRWWNDCASNWRLKWTEVRNERNKLKEECKNLKSTLEDVSKECEVYQAKILDLESEIEKLRDAKARNTEESGKCDSEEVKELIARMETLEFELDEARSQCSALKQEKEELILLGVRMPNNSSELLKCNTMNASTNTHFEIPKEEDVSKDQDLKLAHKALKKVLEEKCVELTAALRRNDLYENEIRKLRTKSEELRKELMLAENEVDSATSTIRRLQRTNGKLQKQMDSVQQELDLHLRECDEDKALDFNGIEY